VGAAKLLAARAVGLDQHAGAALDHRLDLDLPLVRLGHRPRLDLLQQFRG